MSTAGTNTPTLFESLERASGGHTAQLEDVLNAIPWNEDGLIPAIAQQYNSREVLMMAWMNVDTLRETLGSGRVCYWSRSRQKPWRKGESSGQIQMLQEAMLDCDGDTLLLLVDQAGPACHSGRRSCFLTTLSQNGAIVNSDPLISPKVLYGHNH